MKKLILSICMLLMFGAVAFAQDAKEVEVEEAVEIVSDKPMFKFIKTSHDFGKVSEGTQAIHEFAFFNVGTEPLILTNVSASCGCTTPIWPKEPIKAGERAVIKAVYNSKGRPGPFNKSITVTSNATESVKVLKIRGNVDRQQAGTPIEAPASPVIEN